MCECCGLGHMEPLFEHSLANKIEVHNILGIPEKSGSVHHDA